MQVQDMGRAYHGALRFALLIASATGCHSSSTARSAASRGAGTAARGESAERGHVLMLPGISNTTLELAGFSAMLEEAFPDRRVDVRPWGPTMFLLSNLSAFEQNLQKAKQFADELTAYRREYPDRDVDVLGYSGGGAMACFVVASLPPDVQVDRLVLVAPAISRQYPLETAVLPKVKDFVVLFLSPYDPLVGAGTRVFGTMDRRNSASAGSVGFPIEDEKLVQVHWDPKMMGDGHFGGHLDYLSPPWQRKYLLPAFDHRSSLGRIVGSSTGATGSAVRMNSGETANGFQTAPASPIR